MQNSSLQLLLLSLIYNLIISLFYVSYLCNLNHKQSRYQYTKRAKTCKKFSFSEIPEIEDQSMHFRRQQFNMIFNYLSCPVEFSGSRILEHYSCHSCLSNLKQHYY